MREGELPRLAALGWTAPPEDAAGVRHSRIGGPVSYPEAGVEVLDLDSGAGFWFDHRADAILRLLSRLGVSALWDVGGGAGTVAARLRASGIETVVVEPVLSGARAAAGRSVPTFAGTLDSLALPSGSLPAIGLFDVIEHVEDPSALLAECRRVLEPGGALVVTVPAFSWLWGDLDDVAGHYRRYTRRTLGDEVAAVGFRRAHAEYLFASLVPVALITRAVPYRLGRRRGESELLESMKRQLEAPEAVQRIAAAVLAFENSCARRAALPAGLSILAGFRS